MDVHPPSPRRAARHPALGVLTGLLAPLLTLTALSPAGAAEGTTAARYDAVIELVYPTDPAVTSYVDTYDAGRDGGARQHKATDIMGPKMTPVYAAVSGTVSWIVTSGNGYALQVTGVDGRTYGYIHLNNDTPGTDDGQGGPGNAYAPGVVKGATVVAGQQLGWIGDSGNAETTAPHLHFDISDPAVVDPYGSTRINPYASLVAAEAAGRYATPQASPPPPPPPPAPPDLTGVCGPSVSTQSFADVDSTNVHSAAVECLAALEVTLGVGGGLYAPSDQVTRLQMASFTARLLEAGGVTLPLEPPDAFDDDAGTVHELAVNQLAALGVIRGDTGEVGRDLQGRVAMKRDRMAAWMTRAYELIAGEPLPASVTDHFTDDSALHHADINRLADAGIVQGTSPGTYAPRNGVRRDQMSSYLARTLAAATTG